MESLSKAVSNGIYTVNDARNLLDLPNVAGGDVCMVNGSNVKLIDVGAAYGATPQ